MIRFLLLLYLSPFLIQGAPAPEELFGCGSPQKGKDGPAPGPGLVSSVLGAVGSAASAPSAVVAQPQAKHNKCGCHKAKGHKRKSTRSNVLPPIVGKESLRAYVHRVFAIRKETPDQYCARIFRKYEAESNDDYVHRIDTILSEFPWLVCKHNPDYYTLTAHYYYYKYLRLGSDHSDDQYYARILKRLEGEDFHSYIQRMDCVYRAHSRLPVWRRIQFDKEAADLWYTFRQGEYCDNIRPSLNVHESLIEIYKRRKSEEDDDYSYFERICNRRTGENDKDYIERMSRIKARFEHLALWHCIDYLGMIKDYYILIYSKKEKEDLKQYYARLTHKPKTEKLDIYMKRMTILEALFRGVSLWNNEDYLYLTKTYYREVYGKHKGEDNVKYLIRVTVRSCSENVDTYIKRMNIVRWVCKGTDLFYNEKYLKYTKSYYQHFYKKGSETTEIWFQRIYKRSFEESDEEYVRRVTMIREVQGKEASNISEKYLQYVSEFYRLLYKRKKGESTKAWLKRIKSKDESEDDTTYKVRLSFLGTVYTECASAVKGIVGTGKQIILGNSNKKQNCKSENSSNKQRKDSSEEDSSEEGSGEEDNSNDDSSEEDSSKSDSSEESNSEEDTSKNKSKTNKGKSSKSCSKRKEQKKNKNVKENTKKDVSTKTSNKNKKTEGSSTTKKEGKCTKSLTEDKIKKTYEKKDNEDIISYFKRITTKTSTTEEYVKTLAVIRKYYSSLALWYDKKYIDLTSEYYTATYTKLTTESEEKYYERIVTKETYESEEQCAKRVEILRELYPNLPLWSDDKFYEKKTKKVYSLVYKSTEGEDETTYFKRIVEKSEKESDTIYVGRVTLIQKTFKSLSLWSDEKTFAIVKQFYTLKYAKQPEECDDDYIKRLTQREDWETEDVVYVQRIHLIHKVTCSSSVWVDERYYEKYTITYYSVNYMKGESESCESWLTKVFTQLAGESEEFAIKRISLVKKSKFTCGCNCWTEDNFEKIKCTKVFSSDYLSKIECAFFKSDENSSSGSSYEMKSKSSSESSKSKTSAELEEEVRIKN